MTSGVGQPAEAGTAVAREVEVPLELEPILLLVVERLRVVGEKVLVRFTGLQAKLKTWCDVRGEFPDQ